MLDPVIVDFMKMDQKKSHLTYDWTQVFTRPPQARLSLLDRALPAIGDFLITTGNKLKQRSHPRLAAEKAQAPTFMIML